MPHKKTLFIIGAGCSLHYKDATHGINHFISPTNQNFFSMLKLLLDNTTTDSENKINNLFKYLCNSRGIPYEIDRSYLKEKFNDMEEVITDLSIKTSLFEPLNNNENLLLFNLLKELIAYTFGRALYGPISNEFKKLVRLMEPNDVIIIFNYDLLIENSLSSIKRFNPNGYQLEYCKEYKDDVWTKQHKESLINIYKLHGSINWIQCIDCNSLFILDKEDFNKNVFVSKKINKIICPKCKEKNTFNRLIIPPTLSKNYNENPFRSLWRNAEKKIVDIDRIASLGYSLPTTDYATRTLLRSINKIDPKKEISLLTMNRYHHAQEQFQKLLPNIKKTLRSKNISEFVKAFKKL